MPRRVSGSGVDSTYVITEAHALDLGDAPGDVITGIICPGDGAKVVEYTMTIRTAGTGANNHELVLEHGLTTAGVAMAPQLDVLATSAAGTIFTQEALDPNGQPVTVKGTVIQFANAESGAISNGAIVDVSILWRL